MGNSFRRGPRASAAPSHRRRWTMSKKRLSRDQKRKAKLAQRAKRGFQHQSLGYGGNKYRTDELVPVYYRTELGIYEAYVISDHSFSDRTVESALEKLILQMREGTLPPLEDAVPVDYVPGEEEDLILRNIRRNWQILF